MSLGSFLILLIVALIAAYAFSVWKLGGFKSASAAWMALLTGIAGAVAAFIATFQAPPPGV